MLQAVQPHRGGMVVGPPHHPDGTPGGGVHFILQDTGKHIEEEGQEINIPRELRESKKKYSFRGTNAKVLDQILKLGGLSITDKVKNVRSGDIVICVRSAWDDKRRIFNGTIEEILHEINTSGGCKPILKAMPPKGVVPREKDWQALDPYSPRWKKKKERLQELSNNIHRLRLNVSRDLQSEDERTVLTALVVAVMDRSAERIGNDDSADNGHFGVTGFRKKHITVVGNKVHLEYVGKSGTRHDKSISDLRIAKAVKRAIKNAPDKFIFETSDGFRIKSDKVNRYLEPFHISAKDLRGYNANKWIIEKLKSQPATDNQQPEKARKERKKIFNKAVKETAARVGHGAATLKKHYMVPELPVEYIEHGRIIDMKNIGYYKDGGPLGDIAIEKYFLNKNEVPDVVSQKTEEIHTEAQDEGIDKLFRNQVVKEIPWRDVVPTQGFLRSSKFASLASVKDLYDINLPWAVEYNGKYYINDGHHRAAEMNQRGLPVKAHVYPMEEGGGTNEMFELAETKSVKDVTDNIDKIAIQYAHRGMGYTQVEAYLNENNNEFVKKFLSDNEIDSREKLKVFVSNRQSVLRKGRGKERKEFLKSLKEEKTKGNVDNIIEMALEQSDAMDKRIADSQASADPVINRLLSENAQEILSLEFDDSEMLWDEESNRRFYVKRVGEDQFVIEESGTLGNSYPQILILSKQLMTDGGAVSPSAEETKLADLISQQGALKAENDQLYQKEKPLEYGEEKTKISNARRIIYFKLQNLDLKIRHQENVVKALANGGELISFTDKKGLLHSEVPSFLKIKTDNIAFDEETILTDAVPVYIPAIDEEIFSRKGYVFDALRIDKNQYLVAVNGYKEKPTVENIFLNEPRKGELTGLLLDYEQGYVLTTLDQLALISEYYFTKARAVAQKEADEKSKRNEQYYDKLPREKRESHLNQKNFYHALPVKIKKIITQTDYEALSLEEKEKFYKPFKRYGAKRLISRLDDTHMWASYHSMYERFINPQAVPPAPRSANEEVFYYWEQFRDMMKWKIKDIRVQREVDSEIRKIALETSFGESNTNDVLKEEYGILVKRQNGTKISPDEIEQIRKGWVLINKTFGNLTSQAKKDNLKISHTGLKYVFASRAAGVFIPTMNTIAVSNKFGDAQFDQIFSHETAHYIDGAMGGLTGKRHATDDFESTAGIIANTFRKNMNTQSDSDYVNSTVECFARAMEQYFAFEVYGEETELLYSYGELKEVRTYHSEDKYVSKEKFNNRIKPLVKQFLSENQEWFNFGAGSDKKQKTISVKQNPMNQESDNQTHLFAEGGDTAMPKNPDTWDEIKAFLESELPKKLPAEKNKIDLSGKTSWNETPGFEFVNIRPIPYNFKKSNEPLKAIVSDNELRPALASIHYNAENKEKVATDANVLVVIKDDSITTTQNINPETGEEVKEKYPNYQSVIPTDNAFKLHLNETQILILMDQLNGIARAKRFFDWRSEKKIVAKLVTEDITLFMNPSLLIRAINALWEYGARSIDMEFSTPNRVVMLIDSRKNGNKALVMPIMESQDLISTKILDNHISETKSVSEEKTEKVVKNSTHGTSTKTDRKKSDSLHGCAVRLGRRGGLATAKAQKMDIGGSIEDSTETCGCFHSFLTKEKPELVEALESTDINTNPELRSQMDEAHQQWQGGKM